MSLSTGASQLDLIGLAPTSLICYRPSRYAGDDISLLLNVFSEEDRLVVTTLYQRLKELFDILKAHRDQPSHCLTKLQEVIIKQGWPDFIKSLQQLGTSSYQQRPSKLLSQVVHDLKGGALTTLLLRIQLINMGIKKTESVLPMFFLTRDHLKIMRNGLRDVDPEWRQKDQGRQFHSLSLIREKWQNATHFAGTRQVRINLDMAYEGYVAESCLEFSAVDRVIYNLINNAALYAADDQVDFHILTVPKGVPLHLRFVIRNRITAGHQATLRTRFGTQLNDIFIGGFTTGGNGFGMRICAEFVANAYGVHSLERCLAEGYIGAKLEGDSFVVWFHWPTVAD
ncbi:MAG: hypothetical protein K0Q55_358 [Verrucomicrobia bacterium]|jgi:signal transduction histidine kinase|nr:hypothetical protein [Verrucomicrobiota bacterium]